MWHDRFFQAEWQLIDFLKNEKLEPKDIITIQYINRNGHGQDSIWLVYYK